MNESDQKQGVGYPFDRAVEEAVHKAATTHDKKPPPDCWKVDEVIVVPRDVDLATHIKEYRVSVVPYP